MMHNQIAKQLGIRPRQVSQRAACLELKMRAMTHLFTKLKYYFFLGAEQEKQAASTSYTSLTRQRRKAWLMSDGGYLVNARPR